MKKKLIFLFQIIFIYILFLSISFADLQKNLINKITATKTLSFNFKQNIAEKVEFGNCYIKYPLLMKCIYQNLKQKSVISNGKTVAIIKKKYKKIYYYPIRTTPLFIILKKKLIFLFQIIFIYILFLSISFADLQKNLINKITATKTLSFNFKQNIAEKVEFGNCYIKYPLLMKCIYQNLKQKSVISNGKTVAIIKKKYKKIYYYPIRTTPLFIILKKEKILHLIRNNKPTKIDSSIIEFELNEKKSNKLKILFDKNSLEFKGWKTKDAYSNDVTFIIYDLKTNEIIEDEFFKIPKEEDL